MLSYYLLGKNIRLIGRLSHRNFPEKFWKVSLGESAAGKNFFSFLVRLGSGHLQKNKAVGKGPENVNKKDVSFICFMLFGGVFFTCFFNKINPGRSIGENLSYFYRQIERIQLQSRLGWGSVEYLYKIKHLGKSLALGPCRVSLKALHGFTVDFKRTFSVTIGLYGLNR